MNTSDHMDVVGNAVIAKDSSINSTSDSENHCPAMSSFNTPAKIKPNQTANQQIIEIQ